MDIFACTHIGMARENNEDSIAVSEQSEMLYAIVADGMGGHKAGKTASETTVNAVAEALASLTTDEIDERKICEIIKAANQRVYNLAKENVDMAQMGSTLALAVVLDKKAIVANVGDSRVYLFRNKELKQITKDHSYVQTMVDSGKLTPDEADKHPLKNVITKAIGMQEIDPDIFMADFKEGDILLLCSDGLTRHFRDTEIATELERCTSAEKTGQYLIDTALARGGKDNISLIIVKNEGGDLS